MQKVKSKLPSWSTTKTQSKKGFDKAYALVDKLGAPINRWTNKIGSEAFWPTTLDKESYKAARILRSFCKDGFYTEEREPTDQEGPKNAPKVLKKIPQKVIENAVGLAIFTTMRTGLWISGAGGSGVLVARKEDGSWSPPSGIMMHTAGLGFLVGVDIYDCVLVINNRKALEAFTKVRATLGGEISAVAGPVGVGGVLENDGKWKQANRPVFTYLKSRGFYAGVQVDGTVVIERNDENARFYGQEVGVADILAGKVRHVPPEIDVLMETLKAAEGSADVDSTLMDELDGQLAPGDLDLEQPDEKLFGIPEPDDPDPYGVRALEEQGLEIVEAGTRQRPSSQQFEYHPSPTSPAYGRFHRKSTEGESNGTTSNRASYTTGGSTSHHRSMMSPSEPRSSMSDAGTQTDGRVVVMAEEGNDGDGFEKQDIQKHGVAMADFDDRFYDVSDDEQAEVDKDVFVNDGRGSNPWKSSEDVDRDSGVAVAEEEGNKRWDDEKKDEDAASRPRREPPPLPPRMLA